MNTRTKKRDRRSKERKITGKGKEGGGEFGKKGRNVNEDNQNEEEKMLSLNEII